MTFQIPEAEVRKLKSLLSSAIRDKSSSYRKLARIARSLISVALAVGPLSRLFTRQVYLAIESHLAWDHTLHFSSALLEKLRFWYCNIDSFNGYSLRPSPDSSTVIFSDARDVGFGGFSASLDGVTASGMFTTEDLGQSSTFRELKAIYYVFIVLCGAPKVEKSQCFRGQSGRCEDSFCRELQSPPPVSRFEHFLISVFQMGSPSKRSGSPGRKTRKLISSADSLTRTIGSLILQFFVSWMLSGVLTPLTALQPITTLSSYGLTQSLPPPGAVAWMPWLKTGAPKTTGCVPQFMLPSTRSVISSLVPDAGP